MAYNYIDRINSLCSNNKNLLDYSQYLNDSNSRISSSYVHLRNINLLFGYFKNKGISIDESNIDQLKREDVEGFLQYLLDNFSDSYTLQIQSSLSNYWNYLREKNIIMCNYRRTNLKRKRSIVKKFPTEEDVAKLISNIENGYNLSLDQRKYYDKTKNRDILIVKMMAYGGLSLSECVALNISDISDDLETLTIHRYEHDYILNLPEIIKQDLPSYLSEREKLFLKANSKEKALFLSIQKKRIGQRSIQNLFIKYSYNESTGEYLTPDTLRGYCIKSKLDNNSVFVESMKQFGFRSLNNLLRYMYAIQ